MSKFRVGEEVITLKDSSSDSAMYFKKDEIVSVTMIRQCICGEVSINVNNRPYPDDKIMECSICGNIMPHYGMGWARERNFAPIQTQSEAEDMEAAITEVMEREIFA